MLLCLSAFPNSHMKEISLYMWHLGQLVGIGIENLPMKIPSKDKNKKSIISTWNLCDKIIIL